MNATAKRWEHVRAHTRACIREAAAQAFEASGYDGACMDQIASIAGYTKATVYAHYRDKARLFEAVMDWHVSSFIPPTALQEPLPELSEVLAQVARHVQALAHLDASRRFCTTLQRSANRGPFYVALWSVYLAPQRKRIHAAFVREGNDRADEHADLFLQLLLQANSLHVAPLSGKNADAALELFQRAFPSASGYANRSLLGAPSKPGPARALIATRHAPDSSTSGSPSP